jgi:hypothetical protein
MADMLRFVVVILGLVAASQLPGILTRRVDGWRAWVIVAAIEVLLLSRLAGMLSRLGEPIRWYGTPATLAAVLLILVYVASGTAAYRRWCRRRRGLS